MDEARMTNYVLIAKEFVPAVLQLIGQDVEKVIDTFTMGRCTYYNVVQDLYTEHRQLWVLPTEDMQIQGWLVTKIENLATGKRLIFDLFGGEDLDLILTHLDRFEDWAREIGVVETLGFTRPGFRKKLKKHGFQHVCDIVIKPLTKQVH